MSFNWRVFNLTLPDFLKATAVTVEYAVVAIIIGLIWGIIIGAVNYRRVKVLWRFTSAYVTFFRETPLLVQIYFLFYGLARVTSVNPAVIGVTALVLNDGAFIAEIVRGGLQGVDAGQEEAAYSLGFSKFQAMLSAQPEETVPYPEMHRSFRSIIQLSGRPSSRETTLRQENCSARQMS